MLTVARGTERRGPPRTRAPGMGMPPAPALGAGGSLGGAVGLFPFFPGRTPDQISAGLVLPYRIPRLMPQDARNARAQVA